MYTNMEVCISICSIWKGRLGESEDLLLSLEATGNRSLILTSTRNWVQPTSGKGGRSHRSLALVFQRTHPARPGPLNQRGASEWELCGFAFESLSLTVRSRLAWNSKTQMILLPPLLQKLLRSLEYGRALHLAKEGYFKLRSSWQNKSGGWTAWWPALSLSPNRAFNRGLQTHKEFSRENQGHT